MSRFYASIQGSRGEATRQGGKESGITGHIRGWNIGASVFCYVNDEGEDVVRVSLTSGSSYEGHNEMIGEYTRKDLDKLLKKAQRQREKDRERREKARASVLL